MRMSRIRGTSILLTVRGTSRRTCFCTGWGGTAVRSCYARSSRHRLMGTPLGFRTSRVSSLDEGDAYPWHYGSTSTSSDRAYLHGHGQVHS